MNLKRLIIKSLQLAGIRKTPKYFVDIIKSSEEDFEFTKYKGTSIDAIRSVAKIYHPETRVGKLIFGKHISVRNTIELDMVGDIEIGDYVIFSDYVRIFTHDHNVKTRKIILQADEEEGVDWSSIKIGSDVYFGINAIITKSVSEIPDGVIVGANSVLTKNPGAYEIWAGTPAKKIGERQ